MYMYQKLKEAMLMEHSNWSPNSIRSIIITRDFIMVAFHTRQPKLVQLDASESYEDIRKNGTNGALHNLLSQKQLSCLEEIYVDSIFSNYSGIMNLQIYATNLISSVSRLRYYGYIDNVNAQEVLNIYSYVINNGLLQYDYATDKGRKAMLQYVSANNYDWHTKYNLRPDIYKADADNGSLSVWFKKVESYIDSKHKEEVSALREKGIKEAVNLLFQQDFEYSNDIYYFMLAKKLAKLRRGDYICDNLRKVISKVMKSYKPCKIDLNLLKQQLKDNDLLKSTQGTFVLQLYNNKTFGVVERGAEVNLEALIEHVKNREGLLNFPILVRDICVALTKDKDMLHPSDVRLMIYVLLSDTDVDLTTDIETSVQAISKRTDGVKLYVDLLVNMCGCDRNSIQKVIDRVLEEEGDE